jgi:hypothetical protein
MLILKATRIQLAMFVSFAFETEQKRKGDAVKHRQ